MDEPEDKQSARIKRNKFQRSGGSRNKTNTSSWSPSTSSSANQSQKQCQQQRQFSSTSSSSTASSSSTIPALSNFLSDSSEILIEDERPILPGVPIKAASLPALVRLCAQAFGKTLWPLAL